MFTITEQDRRLAHKRADWERILEATFGDVISKRHPLLTTPVAEFIVDSSLECVLEERTKLLRLRYCKGTNSQIGVHVLVTSLAIWKACDELGVNRTKMTHRVVLDVIRKFVSNEIRVEEVRGPLQHGNSTARGLTLPGYDYYSFYLSTDPYPAPH